MRATNCTQRPSSEPMTIDEAQELMDFLTGDKDKPEGFVFGRGHRPKLSTRKAFAVVYVLQERFGLIPDHYELCDDCGWLFDSQTQGTYDEKRGKHFCDSCRP